MLSNEQLAEFTHQVQAFTQHHGTVEQAFGPLSGRKEFFKFVPMAQTILCTVVEHGIDHIINGYEENNDGHVVGYLIQLIKSQNEEAFEYLKTIVKDKSKIIPIEQRVPFLEVPMLWYKSSTRFYLPKLDQVMSMKEALDDAPDFVYINANNGTLENALKLNFIGKKYVAIIYSHPTTGDGAHASLLLGRVDRDGNILKDNLLNIDGFNSESWCKMSEVAYKQRVIIRGKLGNDVQNLQPSSFADINCPVYARNYAKAAMLTDRKVLDVAFTEIESKPKSAVSILPSSGGQLNGVEELIRNMAIKMERYYNADCSLKSNRDKVEYHLKLRLAILQAYFEECAEIPQSIDSENKSVVNIAVQPEIQPQNSPSAIPIDRSAPQTKPKEQQGIKMDLDSFCTTLPTRYIIWGAGLGLGGAVGALSYQFLISTDAIAYLDLLNSGMVTANPKYTMALFIFTPAVITSAFTFVIVHNTNVAIATR